MVEWKKLGEICIPLKKAIIKQGDLIEKGNYPVINSGITLYGWYNSFNNEGNAFTLASRGEYAGYITYMERHFWAGGLCYPYRSRNEKSVITKYIYQYLKNKERVIMDTLVMRGGIPALNKVDVDKILIPIIPLSEQNRIVGYLDTFTDSIENLKQQIAQRRKQFEFYRDHLMDFSENDNVEWKPLGWAFPFIRNGFVGTVTPFFTNMDNGVRYLEGTNIHNGVISDNKELYVTHDFHRKYIKNELKADDVLMVQSGHIGECALVGEKYKGANCHALIIMSNGGNCNSKYIVYYFHTKNGFKSLSPAITGGAIKHVLAKKVGKILIPLPPLSEQSRIVSILDTFEASITNLEAQLAQRQKQYEYYRNQLLTFG